MRASTVFILSLALLVGFVAFAVAKSAGLFSPKPEVPPPPPPPPLKVLAARVNLFEGVAATSSQVYVRDLRPEEGKALSERLGSNWRDKLIQPLPSAVHLRTVRQNILADTILFRDQFEDLSIPESLSSRLEPNTRAVNVAVPKDKAGGGVLRVGEVVDVLLTTKVGINDREEMRTACIARGCKIVMKRNTPWSLMAADPDDKPLHFTLQANPYRAALIEFSQALGAVSLVAGSTPANAGGSYSDPTSKEYATEDQRIDEMVRGTRTVGPEDLVRIFQIPPRPVPPAAKRIQHLAGVGDAGSTVLPGVPAVAPAPAAPSRSDVLPAAGSSALPGAAGGLQAASYTFQLPSATGSECKTCGKDKTAGGAQIRN